MKEEKNKKRETAEKIMTENVPVVDINQSVGQIEKILTEQIHSYDSINYVYIVNARKKLAGVVSIKEVFRQTKKTPVKEIMTKDLVVARGSTDRERVVYKALKQNIKAVPIVDKNGIFKGVVQSDDILKVLHEETEEDFLQMAGIISVDDQVNSVMKTPVFSSFLRRFPWLFVGILGGVLIANIIGFFEKTIYTNIILVAFIPLVTYMASAVSTQVSTFIIRDLAINNNFSFFKYFMRNLMIVLLIAIFSACSFFFISMIFYGEIQTGIILSLAIFVAILSSLFTGLFIPFLLYRIKVDPANASGPFGTIMQDTLSVLIYFFVISLFL